MEKHLDQNIRVAIDAENPSLRRIEDKCIKCGQCSRVCDNFVSVNNNYDLYKNGGKSVCVNCGQCIKACPSDALVIAEEYKQVEKIINEKEKVVIVSTSPSVRVGLGEAFGMSLGSFVEGKMVALLRKLGFNYVLDTNFSADLTICEEATELINRITKKDRPLPQFTSCCPAWIKFVETFYPEIREHISTCKSPIGMQGALIKTYFANKMGISPDKIENVALTPCVAKKFEIRREEMNISAKVNQIEGLRDMDNVITTVELAKWAKEKGISLDGLEESDFDDVMGQASGAGVIFGNTGGVMEAAVRTAYSYITGKRPEELFFNLECVRGLDGIKEGTVEINGLAVKVAVVYGLSNARTLIEKIKAGEHYDFVEIMACPGGCIGGGGQPVQQSNEVEAQKARIQSLYNRDKSLERRLSHENPQIISLYKDYLISPHSEKAVELLHTMYCDRSGDLTKQSQEGKRQIKLIKYHCLICGATFEVEEGKEAECPMCFMKGDVLEVVDERFVEI